MTHHEQSASTIVSASTLLPTADVIPLPTANRKKSGRGVFTKATVRRMQCNSRAGKDIVDHGRSGSDDHANALAGMLRALAGSNYESPDWVCGPDDPAPAMIPMGGNGWEHPLLRHSLLRWR